MRIRKQKSTNKKLLVAALCFAVILLAGVGYFFIQKQAANDREDKYGSSSTTPTEDVPKPTENNDSDNTSIGSSKDDTATNTDTSVSSGVKPATPVGTFVSNHKPNLSGSPTPNSLNSTCSTTAGMQCTIEFTNGTNTKSLPVKTVDANGNASWDWRLQDIGLTAGSWTITAIASNGTLTSQSSDPLKLEVRQ